MQYGYIMSGKFFYRPGYILSIVSGAKRINNQKELHETWDNVCVQCKQRRTDVEQKVQRKQVNN